jgi:predicted DNA-binding protein (MmcQ/YjbR family)
MNKKYWNTILADGTIPDNIIFEWIDHSYNLVKKK